MKKKMKNWKYAHKKCNSPNVHLLKRANIHGMKNVLRIVWMLLKRDGFLEGFSLDDKDNGKQSEHGGNSACTAFPSTKHEHATHMLLKAT